MVRSAGNPLAPVDSPHAVDYGTGLVSKPASSRDVPSISLQEAASSAGQIAAGLVTGQPEVALRRVNYDPAMGPATDQLTVTDRLAWVAIYRNSPPRIHGPISLSAIERASMADALTCVFVVVVDAHTGVGIDSEQICVAKQ
jgi:hypothetical protein